MAKKKNEAAADANKYKGMIGIADQAAMMAARLRAAKTFSTIGDVVALVIKQGCADEYKEAEKVLNTQSRDEES